MKRHFITYEIGNGGRIDHAKHGKYETSNQVNPFTGMVDRRLIRRFGFGHWIISGQLHVSFW